MVRLNYEGIHIDVLKGLCLRALAHLGRLNSGLLLILLLLWRLRVLLVDLEWRCRLLLLDGRRSGAWALSHLHHVFGYLNAP